MAAQDGRPSQIAFTNYTAAERLRRGEALRDIAAEAGIGADALKSRLHSAGWGTDGQVLGRARVVVPLQLFRWPPWVDRALCAQTDPEAFFPEKGGSTKEAKAICTSCPVQVECLDHALANEERFGIWGGVSERDRRKLAGRHPSDPTDDDEDLA